MFVAPQEELLVRRLVDEGRVLIVNLALGRLGSDSAQTSGNLLVSTFGLAALSRAEIAPEHRCPFHFYVGEFHTFTMLSFAGGA